MLLTSLVVSVISGILLTIVNGLVMFGLGLVLVLITIIPMRSLSGIDIIAFFVIAIIAVGVALLSVLISNFIF